MSREYHVARGDIVPHPELGRAIKAARFEGNPSLGPCLELPWWRVPTLRIDDAGRSEAARAMAFERMWMRREAA